ncbi:hypothetical protein IWQ47_001288 [Aquimarina sp. EL_43]|uniref:hypothetical protein n=1 Tax=unclassified Aquimarina TaxID=2627091 RepID=UPI0018C9A648|nr:MULTISPECIES: hypothetical protein [unclassified Aquimarina]MBG6129409.1 hypothetical protein [Aquimarina sp. EL_35]MBG6150474.1 hypothetical protein [Aquimarina sp. EL_32]MBG6168218.1 hypothetical protein [Aquimarina sp. EL_43]
MEYKVVHFERSKDVSSELQNIINAQHSQGWEYINHQYSDKLTPGNDGCFGLGKTPDVVTHVGLIIFKKS